MKLECLTFMIKKITLNDDQLREIMVRYSSTEHGEHQHGDRMMKDFYQVLSKSSIKS